MNNIMKIVNMGICTGCCACNDCENITFEKNENEFYSPIVDEEACNGCGLCLKSCDYAPRTDDDDEQE